MTTETKTEHEHTWLPSVHRHRWCGDCLHKEMRVDIGCEIWLPVLYGDALTTLQEINSELLDVLMAVDEWLDDPTLVEPRHSRQAIRDVIAKATGT